MRSAAATGHRRRRAERGRRHTHVWVHADAADWSADGSKTSKTPTHVSVYNTADLAQSVTGLDREGMVLVALMSGGDYIPEGVPGCGVKVACEAARAGFGKTICRIKKANAEALAAWRDSLLHELRTNEGGFFRTRHKALQIPDSFPDMDVLRYYTHPVVSPPATVDRLKADFPSARAVDVSGLREFVSETFDWTCRIGAVKFIRVLGPSLLVQKMLALSSRDYNAKSIPAAASTLVNGITTRRSHFSTDATPELRVSYTPAHARRHRPGSGSRRRGARVRTRRHRTQQRRRVRRAGSWRRPH